MAQTFLQLTNRVLKAFNEVNLDSSTFASADGFYQEAKDAVNQAIFDLYTEEDAEWPFAWSEASFNTVAGTTLYTPTASATAIDWDSFRINYDSGNNIAPDHLPSVDYNVYRANIWQKDSQLTSDQYGKPSQIVRRPDNKVIITTVPDQVYSITYEYFTIPDPLVDYDDEPVVPTAFSQLIIDKALHYAYMFRDNVEQAALANDRYERNINKVRRILIPQFQNIVAVV